VSGAPVGPPAPGVVLEGNYRLNRLLSEGGMGSVFEATQLRLSRRVAVKIMAPELTESTEALARFRREVEVTSQLAHPHVIQLYDFGTAPSGEPFLVMEFLEGEDLEHRLLRVGRLPLGDAVDLVRQIGSALAATHAKGIVHRDLKPANIFLLPLEGVGDFVKLVDFGISKVRTARTKLTRAFTMVGTPEYMSPEQAVGSVDDVDHRSDQWALGCMAWRMLSAQVPFQGRDLKELLSRVVQQEPPSLATLVPDLPREVEAVLRRALAKRQADRFPTITAFVRAFEAAAARKAAAPAAAPAVQRAAAPEAPPQRAAAAARPAAAAAPAAASSGGLSRWLIVIVSLLALGAGAAYYFRADLSPVAPVEEPEPARPEIKPAAGKRPPAGAKTKTRAPGE
jgi:eukaryotic-like serine/threonine-protein kinase